jgi:transposase
MQVRETIRRRGKKTYRSTQIVESYRRPDGMPAKKVLVSLGALPPLEVENLKRAVAASRVGQAVVLPSQIATQVPARKVRSNLEYLDIAVAYRLWRYWELGELIDELVPDSQSELSVGQVTAGLVMQRCVAPGSKLLATRWYPKTALVELQGIAPSKFNNTRIHRVLEALESIEAPLQQRLAQRIETRQGRFVSLFLDCTDTWFVGSGPESASKRITKEGMVRRRIGIVLLCDHRGYPLRWATVAGNHNECDTMMGILRQVADLPWVDQVPVAFDRAMGRGVTVGALLSAGVRFVTAVPCNEIASYTDRIPLGIFDDILQTGQTDPDNAVEKLHQAALDAGFEQVSERNYVLDLGVFDKGEHEDTPATVTQSDADALSRAKAALRIAWRLRAALESGEATSPQELAERFGCSRRHISNWLCLLQLNDRVQQRVLAGHADRVPPMTLVRIARQSEHAQYAAFDEACQAAGEGPALHPNKLLAKLSAITVVQVRGVVLFNPSRLIEQRQSAERQLSKLQAFIDDLNRGLRSPNSRRNRKSILAAVGAELKHHQLLSVFDIEVETVEINGRSALQVQLHRDETEWQRRRCTDGFTLIIAHPKVLIPAAELVELYFAKDMVEKDFQTIKSVIRLRPIHHQTDHKVHAHVTVCMLALLVERTIEQRLQLVGIPMTAAAVLTTLHSCHLNLYTDEGTGTYSVTECDPDQHRILDALDMKDLADDDLVAQVLTPR